VCHSTYMEENLGDAFKSRMHSQRLIMNLNETFCEDAKWTHISHSKVPVADHYMITNSSSTKCVYFVRSEDVTAMLLMIQFYWDVM